MTGKHKTALLPRGIVASTGNRERHDAATTAQVLALVGFGGAACAEVALLLYYSSRDGRRAAGAAQGAAKQSRFARISTAPPPPPGAAKTKRGADPKLLAAMQRRVKALAFVVWLATAGALAGCVRRRRCFAPPRGW